MGKRTYALDFDGTLSLGRFPRCGPPNEKLIEVVKEILSQPYDYRPALVLWTCRTGEYLREAVEWLKEQGIEFDPVPESDFPGKSDKVHAELYVDDRAASADQFIDMYHTGRIYR